MKANGSLANLGSGCTPGSRLCRALREHVAHPSRTTATEGADPSEESQRAIRPRTAREGEALHYSREGTDRAVRLQRDVGN